MALLTSSITADQTTFNSFLDPLGTGQVSQSADMKEGYRLIQRIVKMTLFSFIVLAYKINKKMKLSQ